jgi:hypothetical protein
VGGAYTGAVTFVPWTVGLTVCFGPHRQVLHFMPSVETSLPHPVLQYGI